MMALVMQTLTRFPESFAAGTTVKYTRSLSDYPANDGWTMTVHLRGDDNTANATVTPSGADYVVEFMSATTAGLVSGQYQWAEIVTKSGVGTVQADHGNVFVEPNFATAGPGGLRTHEERVLAALRAKLEGRITADQETLHVEGMLIERIPLKEIPALIDRYQAKVSAQKSGGAPLRRTLVTFRRPS